jgi:hypothetical protein
MQAVSVVLLLVAGSLVHSAPQVAQEGGKSMYKYRKRFTYFIKLVAAVGYSSFLRDMIADTQASNLIYKRLLLEYAFYYAGINIELKFFLGNVLTCTKFPLLTLLSDLKKIFMIRCYPSGNVSSLSI